MTPRPDIAAKWQEYARECYEEAVQWRDTAVTPQLALSQWNYWIDKAEGAYMAARLEMGVTDE